MRTNAVTSSKVKNRSLLASDFALGQLPAGAPGANGATGPTGPQGATGVVGSITVQRDDFTLANDDSAGAQVECPAGTRIIGGGSSIDATVRPTFTDRLTAVSPDARGRRN